MIDKNLKDILVRYIRYSSGNVISIAQFMQIINYHVNNGYYSKSTNSIGKDFITSPHISCLFGYLVGFFLYQKWEKFFFNKEICLVELGGGNGNFLYDVLSFLEDTPLFNYLKISVLEISPFLKNVQSQKLKKFIDKIKWCQEINEIKTNRFLFFISNEFFDCLPIHQFFLNEQNKFNEIMVCLDDKEELHLGLVKNISHNFYLLNEFEDIEKNLKNKQSQIFEICPSAIFLCKEINSMLNKNGGLFLTIDYGNFESTGKSSLQSIINHQNCASILSQIEQGPDISAHVNFAHLKKCFMQELPLEYFLVNQKEFIKKLKIDVLLEDFSKSNLLENSFIFELKNQIDYLTSDEKLSDMGSLFKVLYILKTH